MIPLQRAQAPVRLERLLLKWTNRVRAGGATTEVAREHWRKAKTPKDQVRALLEAAAHGASRCMYCDDSRGTDIDHFQPLASAPLRAFVWPNHLLACGWCNSNAKRELYPLAADGTCLLVDPTAEDPAQHLFMRLTSCLYDFHTAKGRTSIEVFGLNRPDLVQGRERAFKTACVFMEGWHQRHLDGDPSADEAAQALLGSPFVDVVYTMARLAPDIAETVVEQRTLPALAHWRSVYGGGPP